MIIYVEIILLNNVVLFLFFWFWRLICLSMNKHEFLKIEVYNYVEHPILLIFFSLIFRNYISNWICHEVINLLCAIRITIFLVKCPQLWIKKRIFIKYLLQHLLILLHLFLSGVNVPQDIRVVICTLIYLKYAWLTIYYMPSHKHISIKLKTHPQSLFLAECKEVYVSKTVTPHNLELSLKVP